MRIEEDPIFNKINPLGIVNYKVEGKEDFSSGTPINRDSISVQPDTGRKLLYRDEPHIRDSHRKTSYAINGKDPRYEDEYDQRYDEETTGRDGRGGRSRKGSNDKHSKSLSPRKSKSQHMPPDREFDDFGHNDSQPYYQGRRVDDDYDHRAPKQSARNYGYDDRQPQSRPQRYQDFDDRQQPPRSARRSSKSPRPNSSRRDNRY